MYLHASNIDADQYEVIYLKTGKPIRLCRWADDETGEYEVYVLGKNGEVQTYNNGKNVVTERKFGRIKLVKKLECRWYYPLVVWWRKLIGKEK